MTYPGNKGIIFIKVLGVIVALVSLYIAIFDLRSISIYGLGTNVVISLILTLLLFITGIGIFQRNDIARSFYLVLALLVLGFSVWGTYKYISSVHQSDLANSQASSSYKSSEQTLIYAYEHDPSLTPSQRQQDIQNVQKEYLSQPYSKQQPEKIAGFALWQIITYYSLAIIPVLFLTRKRLKQYFNY